MKKLTITFDAEGTPKIETTGCEGQECKSLTKDIEKALGETVSDEAKPEMHQYAKATRNLHQ